MLNDPLLFSAVTLNVYLNPVIRLRMVNVTEEALMLVTLLLSPHAVNT